MSKKQTKTQKYKANMRTYFLSDKNINIITTLNEMIISAKNITKLINYGLDQSLGKTLKRIMDAKTSKERETLIVKFTMEVKKYANTEESIN